MEPEIKYMKAALREARKAEKLEEVPIGCVIVQNDKIIAGAITGAILIKIHFPMRN